jgi:hypothetical protein
MATYKEKKKKLAQQRRVRKMEKELGLLATGAGMYWQENRCWEYKDDPETCLGNFMRAVSDQYALPSTSFIFDFWNFRYWRAFRELAPKVLQAIENQKQEQAGEAA